jgi:hypothetical protein
MEFISLGTEFIEMLDSDVGKAVFGGASILVNYKYAN